MLEVLTAPIAAFFALITQLLGVLVIGALGAAYLYRDGKQQHAQQLFNALLLGVPSRTATLPYQPPQSY
jgi:hypothetical protein